LTRGPFEWISRGISIHWRGSHAACRYLNVTESRPSIAPAPSLSSALSGSNNAFGVLRLSLALLVIVDHAFPLGGFGEDPMWAWSRGQDSLGGIAVAGFFAISGYLIAKSALHTDWLQFLWRRGLRIFPAYWGVLFFSAFLLGPVVWKLEGLGLRTYLTRGAGGPFSYVLKNAFLQINQYGVHTVFTSTTPYGVSSRGSVLNGSLWTLSYEWCCYLMVLAFGAFAVLRRARLLVLILAIGTLSMVNLQLVMPESPAHLLPWLQDVHALRFTCIFLFGSAAALYGKEIPMDDKLGAGALLVFLGSLFTGGYFLVGYPALAYSLMWLAARLPAPLRAIGAKNDYSYGVYLYGFPVQQMLAYLGVYRWGRTPYIAASIAATLPLAIASWHLLEKRLMRLKDLGPGLGSRHFSDFLRQRGAAPAAPVEGGSLV